MPALSPTMEQGKLARWLVKEGDHVASGDILAEIETDKATMEFEAVDEGTILSIAIPADTDGVKVGTVIATLAGDDEDAAAPAKAEPAKPLPAAPPAAAPAAAKPAPQTLAHQPLADKEDRVIASPLAKRLAAEKGVDLATLAGSGPHGRIVKADIEGAQPGSAQSGSAQAAAKPAVAKPAAAPAAAAPAPAAAKPAVTMADETRALLDERIPHTVEKLSGMRKTIARRLAQSMQSAPHIYLTVDIRLDKLLALRTDLNDALAKSGVKLSVNDMLIKALGKALIEVPECNVTFAGNELIRYQRADVSVAVSIPGGLITPIVQDANGRSLAAIAGAMKDLGARAREGKLLPTEYQGGTASLSNMGMMGIKAFTAVINPPQSTILAIGAGEKRPWVMPDGSLGVANAMTATGSFDHRAVDGADGARLMAAFRELCEKPLGLVA
jgi:pyruvate dehydrogenase E2 component (dihydrolipoamide acetyltransferase)